MQEYDRTWGRKALRADWKDKEMKERLVESSSQLGKEAEREGGGRWRGRSGRDPSRSC